MYLILEPINIIIIINKVIRNKTMVLPIFEYGGIYLSS